MLKNRYEEILIGLNLASLVRGLISRKRNRTTLLIDDQRFRSQTYPGNFLSELEILALARLGKTHDVPELVNIRQFLTPASMEFILDKRRLLLGQSPLRNLKEVLRKFPELLDKSDLDLVYAETEETFDQYFLEETARFESLCYEGSFRPKGIRFELNGPKWLKTIYQRFSELLNSEYSLTQDLRYSSLLHLLGLSSEEKLKTKMAPEEIPFFFLRMLSPINRLQDFFLMTQLKRRLLVAGGDYKESEVQFWQLHENKFENLLLASFEGVVSGDRVLFFAHLPTEVPFTIMSPYPFFRKTQFMPLKKPLTPFPPTKLTFLVDEKYLGSEKPYRVFSSLDHEVNSYQWPYRDLPGSKASFYQKAALESLSSDSKSVPFEIKDPTTQTLSAVSLDMRSQSTLRKTEASVLSRLPLEIVQENKIIQGFEYWGPFRYRSMGFMALCYGIEGV